MTASSSSTATGVPRVRRARSLGRRLLVVAIAVVVVLAAYAAYAYVASLPPPGTTRLVVYTYASFFGGNCSVSAPLAEALAPFESREHVSIDLECPPDLLYALESEKAAPNADVVVGLDEVTGPKAMSLGLVTPYVSPELANVSPDVAGELDPGHGITPYEWGYLAVDYTPAFYNATHGAIAHSSFSNFTSNTTWRNGLLIENPTTDIVGEEFLLWEIEFSEAVLHENWTTWWIDGGAKAPSAPDWGTAFNEFLAQPTVYPTVVSYTTDSAYAAGTGAPGSLNTTVTTWNGTQYGWRTVYGAGVVQGSHHSALSEALIDWLLEGPVQTAIPSNEWEYPANTTTPLPPSFSAAPDPTGFVALNDYTTPAAIASQLPNYLAEWQTIENQYG